MSDYDRRPQNQNRRDRRSSDYDDDRGLDDLRIPDLRRRSSHYGHSRDWEEQDNQAADDGMLGMGGLGGCLRSINVRWLFIGLLVLAAMRGGSRERGCLPSRGCINTFLLNIAGIALMIGGVYVYDTNGDGNIAGALGVIGGLACLIGTGGVFFLIWATLKMIDLNPFDDDGGDDDDGPLGMLGNILGR